MATRCSLQPATLQGSKKTKLGLREFVKLGNFTQSIDVDNSIAVSARGG